MRNGFCKTKSDDLLICRHKQICLGGKINCELQHDDDANNIIQISQEFLLLIGLKVLNFPLQNQDLHQQCFLLLPPIKKHNLVLRE